MRKIYKYKLPEMPGVVTTINEKIIKILSVQYQNGVPTVWAIVDPDDTSVAAEIIAFGTGWELPNGAERYVGSLQDPEGYVWHYFIVRFQDSAVGEVGMMVRKVFDTEGLFNAYI